MDAYAPLTFLGGDFDANQIYQSKELWLNGANIRLDPSSFSNTTCIAAPRPNLIHFSEPNQKEIPKATHPKSTLIITSPSSPPSPHPNTPDNYSYTPTHIPHTTSPPQRQTNN
jgi:hypothetical protein